MEERGVWGGRGPQVHVGGDAVRAAEALRGARCAVVCRPAAAGGVVAGPVGHVAVRRPPVLRAEDGAAATRAGRVSLARCARLVDTVRETLEKALKAGGSSLRDFVHADGSSGYFQQAYFVYGRDGLPCRVCATTIRVKRMGQRSTFYCPQCQRN